MCSRPAEAKFESAVQAFMAAEVLGPEDTWKCPKCKEGVQARTQLHLWTVPEVLVVHLKRFILSGMRHCSKIDDEIAIPLEVCTTSHARIAQSSSHYTFCYS